MFALMEFLTALVSGGIYMTIFVLAIEFAGARKRVFSGTLMSIAYPIGQALTGLLAFFIRDFRVLLRSLFGPQLMVLTFIWLVPESLRWLLVKGKILQVKQQILQVAKVNGMPLNPDHLDNIFESDGVPTELVREIRPNLYLEAIKSRLLIIRLLICFVCWFANAFVYHGMNVHSVSLGGNKYVNYILVNLVEIPAVLLTSLLLDTVGRKRTLCGGFMVGTVSCLIAEISSNYQSHQIKMVLYVMGKFAVTISFTSLYVFTSELFPTSMRQTFMNASLMVGSVGSMVAPFTPLLVSA